MTSHVVNVCFHGIGTPRRELEPGEAPFWVAVDQFHHLLDEVATWPNARISFDDGNISDVEVGLPALLERGLRATFFVLAGRIESPGSLGRGDIKNLAAAGMSVGSHGKEHVPWRHLDRAAAARELVEARDLIADVTGVPVTEAACPLGRYDRGLLAQLKHLGYTRVYTSDRGRARPHAWLQPRFSVRTGDTAATARREMLQAPGLTRQARRVAVTTVKRLR